MEEMKKGGEGGHLEEGLICNNKENNVNSYLMTEV